MGSFKQIAMSSVVLEDCLLYHGQVSKVLKQVLRAARSAKAQALSTCLLPILSHAIPSVGQSSSYPDTNSVYHARIWPLLLVVKSLIFPVLLQLCLVAIKLHLCFSLGLCLPLPAVLQPPIHTHAAQWARRPNVRHFTLRYLESSRSSPAVDAAGLTDGFNWPESSLVILYAARARQ